MITAIRPVETGEVTRRSFYVSAMAAIWGVIGAALGLPAAAYLLFPPKTRKNDVWVEAGDVSKLTANQPVELTFRRTRTDGWKVVSEKVTAWVIKTPSEGLVAFGPQCTHLGCAHHWDEAKDCFLCPCHNSVFSPDGKVVSGPAPRPLDRYDAKIQGTKILLGSLRQERSA